MKQKLVLALDMSGSMRQETVVRAYEHVLKLFGKPKQIIGFDSEVYKIDSLKKPFKGRGGTDYQCLKRWLEKHKSFTKIVVVTDGYGDTKFSVKNPDSWSWLIVEGTTEHITFGFTIEHKGESL